MEGWLFLLKILHNFNLMAMPIFSYFCGETVSTFNSFIPYFNMTASVLNIFHWSLAAFKLGFKNLNLLYDNYILNNEIRIKNFVFAVYSSNLFLSCQWNSFETRIYLATFL
ncbi:hypothetical protein CN491_02745 [Bacillus cereus]|uniref:Uncharacterized protein n=1 Tax=Bacillus cereus TaxID=1396 RepID=A0A2A8LWE0_BACCE|nr:hypothetical protein CN491_02745 [Bacillus cereus]